MNRRTFFAGLTALIAHAVGASPARGEVYIPLVRKDGGPGPSPTNTVEPSVTPTHTPEPSATASQSPEPTASQTATLRPSQTPSPTTTTTPTATQAPTQTSTATRTHTTQPTNTTVPTRTASPRPTNTTAPTATRTATASSGGTVYITNTGAKYHRWGCRYLSESAIPKSCSWVKANGYTPCGVCKPYCP